MSLADFPGLDLDLFRDVVFKRLVEGFLEEVDGDDGGEPDPTKNVDRSRGILDSVDDGLDDVRGKDRPGTADPTDEHGRHSANGGREDFRVVHPENLEKDGAAEPRNAENYDLEVFLEALSPIRPAILGKRVEDEAEAEEG